MPPSANPTEFDLIGLILTALPFLLSILVSGKRVHGLLELLRKFAALVVVKDAKQEGEVNGHHTHAAMMLAMSSNDKRLDALETRVEANESKFLDTLRREMDSLHFTNAKIRSEIREGFNDVYSKIDVTNQRMNVIGSELTKLQAVVYSMNGNGKHASDDEEKADE